MKPSVTAPTRFYIPSLDGVRALAFGVVFVAHTGDGNHGMFGVTIFFFLSGFLITTLLRRENDQHGTVSLSAFYLRRAIRIFPPFYLTIAFILLLAATHLSGSTYSPGSFVAASLFAGNYWTIFEHTRSPGLTSLWSLAVEEHFYIFFPLVFLLMNRFGVAYKKQALLLAGLCVVVLAWRADLVLHYHYLPGVRLDYATDTRIDSILFGCILALFANPVMDKDAKPSKLLVVAGAVVMIVSIMIHNPVYRGVFHFTVQGLALMPIFAGVIWYSDTWFRWLNGRVIRFIGTLTYTLYLVHLSILAVAFRHVSGRLVASLLALVGTLVFAWLMNRLVERPLIVWRRRLS